MVIVPFTFPRFPFQTVSEAVTGVPFKVPLKELFPSSERDAIPLFSTLSVMLPCFATAPTYPTPMDDLAPVLSKVSLQVQSFRDESLRIYPTRPPESPIYFPEIEKLFRLTPIAMSAEQFSRLV